MKNQVKFRLFYIPWWTIPLQICCGFAFMYFFEPEMLSTIKGIILTMFYTLLMGIPVMKGYEYIDYRMEIEFPWLKAPVKRMVYTMLFQSSFLSFLLIAFIVVMFGLQNNFEWTLMLTIFWKAAIAGIGFSVVATFFANSMQFFVNWKAAAVNEEVLKREKLMLEYEILKGQVNPHFLFNSFTALSSLVYKDQDKAVEFINQLSKVYRYVLEQKDKEIVSLEEELAFLNSVVYLYSIRFEQNLKVDISVDFQKDEMIVPMSLQMLFENAVKHNEISDKAPLRVDIFRENDSVIVRNNLQLRSTKPPSSSIGLSNIGKRYNFLVNKDIEVKTDEKEFLVKIPIIRLADYEGTDS